MLIRVFLNSSSYIPCAPSVILSVTTLLFMTTVITLVQKFPTFFKAVFILLRHYNAAFTTYSNYSIPAVPKMCYADPEGSATRFQEMGGKLP